MDKFAVRDIGDEGEGQQKMEIPCIKMEGRPIKGKITKQQSQGKSYERRAMFQGKRKDSNPEGLQQKTGDHDQKNEEQGHIIPHLCLQLGRFEHISPQGGEDDTDQNAQSQKVHQKI